MQELMVAQNQDVLVGDRLAMIKEHMKAPLPERYEDCVGRIQHLLGNETVCESLFAWQVGHIVEELLARDQQLPKEQRRGKDRMLDDIAETADVNKRTLYTRRAIYIAFPQEDTALGLCRVGLGRDHFRILVELPEDIRRDAVQQLLAGHLKPRELRRVLKEIKSSGSGSGSPPDAPENGSDEKLTFLKKSIRTFSGITEWLQKQQEKRQELSMELPNILLELEDEDLTKEDVEQLQAVAAETVYAMAEEVNAYLTSVKNICYYMDVAPPSLISMHDDVFWE